MVYPRIHPEHSEQITFVGNFRTITQLHSLTQMKCKKCNNVQQ